MFKESLLFFLWVWALFTMSLSLPTRTFLSNKHNFSTDEGYYRDTNSKYEMDKTSNSSCALQIVDWTFPDLISKIKDEGNGLIFFNLQIEDELSATIKDSLILPMQWIWATEHFGSNMLLLREQMRWIIHKYLHLGIAEQNVSIVSEPKSCLLDIKNITTYEAIVLRLFLPKNNSKEINIYQSDRICKLDVCEEIQLLNPTRMFCYYCYTTSPGQTRFTKSKLAANTISMKIIESVIMSFIIICMLFMTIYIYLVVPYINTRNNDMKVNLRGQDVFLIEDARDSFHISTWIYENLFLCRLHEKDPLSSSLKNVCNSKVIPCFDCRMFICLKRLNQLVFFILWICTFFAIMKFYPYFIDKEFEIRSLFMLKHGYVYADTTNFEISISICCWYCITFSILFVPLYYCFVKSVRDDLQNGFDESKISSWEIFEVQEYSCWIRNCLCLPIEYLSLQCLRSRFRILFLYWLLEDNQSKFFFHSLKIAFLFILLIPFSFLFSFMMMTFIVNVIFSLVVTIVNFEAYRGYVVTILSVLFYAINCSRKLEQKYRSSFETFQKYVKNNIISKINLSETGFSEIQSIKFNHRTLEVGIRKLEGRNTFYFLEIWNNTQILFDKGEKVLISRSFFEKMISRKEKGFPGTPLSNICILLTRVILLFFFISCMMLITASFGDAYYGSNAVQAAITISTCLLPWLIGNKLLQTEWKRFDIEDKEVQEIIMNLLESEDIVFRYEWPEQITDSETIPLIQRE